MPLNPKNLDDRNFDQLVAEAWKSIQDKCPAWSDRSPGDPGTVMVELFAYLTDVLLYRLNRLPEKAYIELLRLMGVTVRPPTAAVVTLRFSEARPAQPPVEVAAPEEEPDEEIEPQQTLPDSTQPDKTAADRAGAVLKSPADQPEGAKRAAPGPEPGSPQAVASSPLPSPQRQPPTTAPQPALGVQPVPPTGSGAPPPVRLPIEIPQGTGVTLGRGGAGPTPVFVTTRTVTLAAEDAFVEVDAVNAEDVAGELAGAGMGRGGLVIRVARPPIIARGADEPNLVVGVASLPTDSGPDRTRDFNGRSFRIWREVEHFADLGADRYAYVADRESGTITFAPDPDPDVDPAGKSPQQAADASRRALAPVPMAGREIRVWYRRGGGAGGNVGPETLTSLKKPIPGVVVTNPQKADGGRDSETPAEAIARGPQSLHSLRRAVTARDFQRVAEGTGQIARAWAYTKAQIWKHAKPGTIEVLLVPSIVNRRPQDPVWADMLLAARSDWTLKTVREELQMRQPLGTSVNVVWIRCRSVRVQATIVAFDGEDPADLEARVRRRLDQFISPLDSPLRPGGWPFGQPMNVGRLYNALFAEPGLKDVRDISCIVDEAPSRTARSISADAFQPHTWHVVAADASGAALFRTRDDGDGWEKTEPPQGIGADERLTLVRAHRVRAGLVAAVTRIAGAPDRGVVYVSEDCGQTYRRAQPLAFAVNDAAWIVRDGFPALILACERGLYELNVEASKRNAGDALRLIPIEGLPDDHCFYSVTVTFDVTDRPAEVAVAARVARTNEQKSIGGVYMSYTGGLPKSFINVSQGVLAGRDVRCLAAQRSGSRWYIWAGTYVSGAQDAEGLFRWEEARQPWKQFKENWDKPAGTCYSIAVCGTRILAATYGQGVMWLDTATPDAQAWHAPGRDCGLPLQQGDLPVKAPLDTVWSVAADPDGKVILAGTDLGVFRSKDLGVSYHEKVSNIEHRTSVPLPDSSIFCPGQHTITIVSEGSSA